MILKAFFVFVAAAIPLTAGVAQAQQVPFEIARLQKDFPVTLYSGAGCKTACDEARAALNRRSIPFTEVTVLPDDEASVAKLRAASGSNQLPVLTVGRSVQIGFEAGQYDALLDSAGYPAAGTYPPRNQKPPSDVQAKPEAPKPPAGPKPGPYDTSGLQGPAPKPGPYDPSGLQGPTPKPGPYGVPAETK